MKKPRRCCGVCFPSDCAAYLQGFRMLYVVLMFDILNRLRPAAAVVHFLGSARREITVPDLRWLITIGPTKPLSVCPLSAFIRAIFRCVCRCKYTKFFEQTRNFSIFFRKISAVSVLYIYNTCVRTRAHDTHILRIHYAHTLLSFDFSLLYSQSFDTAEILQNK